MKHDDDVAGCPRAKREREDTIIITLSRKERTTHTVETDDEVENDKKKDKKEMRMRMRMMRETHRDKEQDIGVERGVISAGSPKSREAEKREACVTEQLRLRRAEGRRFSHRVLRKRLSAKGTKKK